MKKFRLPCPEFDFMKYIWYDHGVEVETRNFGGENILMIASMTLIRDNTRIRNTDQNGLPPIVNEGGETLAGDICSSRKDRPANGSDSIDQGPVVLSQFSVRPKVSQTTDPGNVHLFDPAPWTRAISKVSKSGDQGSGYSFHMSTVFRAELVENTHFSG